MTDKEEPMDITFAVFNGHVNGAFEKANLDFVKKYGSAEFDRIIEPLHKAGIMTIFLSHPTEKTKFYAERVQHYVNEGR